MDPNKELITVHNGENFIFSKVTIMENGELKFEIEKEEPVIEKKKNCIKCIGTCTST